MSKSKRGGVSGLFFSSLDREQTNVDQRGKAEKRRQAGRKETPEFEKFCRGVSFRRPPAKPVESNFRHSGWLVERLRVRHAMLTANVTQSRYERFTDCGSDCVVEFSPSRNAHRTRANYCGDRFCLPCARARAAKVRARMESLVAAERPLMITLTVRNKDVPLTVALNHLLKSFRRLRQQKIWRKAIRGGAAFVEVKRGSGSKLWHPHLHVIAVGLDISPEDLRDAWFLATGDSFQVKIERAHSPSVAGHYATKYATKGWTAEVARVHDHLVECILSLRGRRLCITFGEWVGVELEEGDRGPEDWKRVGTLAHVFDRFLAGEEWAAGVFRSLKRDDVEASWLKAPPD